MLFCLVAFSVVVKRLILYVTYQKAICLQTPCTAPCWRMPDEQLLALSLGSQEQCVIQAFCTEELQCLLQAVHLLSSSPPSPLHPATLAWALLAAGDWAMLALSAQQAARAFLLPVGPELISWTQSLLFPKPLWKTWGNVALSICLLFDLPWVWAALCS